MKISLDEILNIHKGEPCLILGSGESLNNLKFENFSGQIIALGSTILRLKKLEKISYFVSANNHFPIPEIQFHLDFLNGLKNTTWLMSDTAAYNDIWKKNDSFLNENIKINWLSFDDRHFNKKVCNPIKPCCDIAIANKNNLTLQEYFFKKMLNTNDFIKPVSVAEFGIMFAILFGCNPIYIAGIDMPKENYWGHKSNKEYFGYESNFANEFLNKTNKLIKKKYLGYYLKNLNFLPYLNSAYLQLISKISKKSFFAFDIDKFEKNFEKIAHVASINKREIINLGNSDIIKKTKGIKSLKIENLS